MTAEYDASATARPAPEGLEHKSTADTLIGHTPALVPNASRTGAAVSDDEREDAQVFPGTFAAGNGVQNDQVRRGGGGGARDGLATDSGGTQRSGRGVTGAARTTKTTRSSTGARAGSSSAPAGSSTPPAGAGSSSGDSGQPKG